MMTAPQLNQRLTGALSEISIVAYGCFLLEMIAGIEVKYFQLFEGKNKIKIYILIM